MAKVNYAESVKGEDETKRFSEKAKNGLIILATVGIGCGIYGFKLGRTLSYRRGFRDGEIYANDQFRDLAKIMIETVRKSKGE